jgi:hypothetical protein
VKEVGLQAHSAHDKFAFENNQLILNPFKKE